MIANGGGCDQPHTCAIHFFRVHRDGVGNDDDSRVCRAANVESEGAGTASDNEPNVAVHDAVGFDCLLDRGRHFRFCERDLQADGEGAFVEAVDVLSQQEHLPRVNSNAFKDAVAVQQTVIKNTDHCLFGGNESTGEVNQSGHG